MDEPTEEVSDEEAMWTMATHIIACEAKGADWRDWPGIGEFDWEWIMEMIDSLVHHPHPENVTRARKVLAARMEKSDG